jgi:hypothetical protein
VVGTAWQRAGQGMKGGSGWDGRGWTIVVGQPTAHNAVLQLIKDFQGKSNFKRSKASPIFIQKFQIKYEIVGN